MTSRRLVVPFVGTILTAGCTLATPMWEVEAPRPGHTGDCATYIARAHAAFASTADPANAGVGAAEHAHAMHQYHACLASGGS